jgi:hypothetical protein
MKVLLYAVFKDREGSNDIAQASRRTAPLRKVGGDAGEELMASSFPQS